MSRSVASGDAFGAAEARAQRLLGLQVADLADQAVGLINQIRARRQRAEDNAAIAEIQTRMLVEEMSFRQSIREAAPANGAGMIDAYQEGWTQDRVNGLIDEVSEARGYRLSEDARQILFNRGMSLQATGIVSLGRLEDEARAGVFANGIRDQANALATAVYNSPGDIDVALNQVDTILDGAQAYLGPLELQELQQSLPQTMREAWYRGRLANGDAAGVLEDLRNPENGDYGVPHNVALNLIEEAQSILEVDEARAAGMATADQIISDARAGIHPTISGAAGMARALPTSMAQAPATLVDAVIQTESSGNPNVGRGAAGEVGLMQILPATGRDIAQHLGETRVASLGNDALVDFLSNPSNNQRYGETYLNMMLERYGGDTMLAVLAYNAGPGSIDRAIREIGDPRRGEVTYDEFLARVGNAEYYRRVAGNVAGGAVSQPGTGQQASGRIIAFGDSIAVGMGGVDNVESRGVEGAGFYNGLLPALGVVEDGDVVLISVGSNDVGEMTPQAYRTAMSGLVGQVINSGGIPVVTGLNADHGETFRQFNQIAREVAEELGVVFVPSRVPDAGDRLHFSQAGYQQRVSDALSALEARPPVRPPVAAEPGARGAVAQSPGWYEAAINSPRLASLTPEAREIAETRINREWQNQQRVEAERLANDRTAAWEHIDNGGSVETLPADLVARLPRGEVQAMREAEAGALVVTDRDLYDSLLDMTVEQSETFIATDLQEYRGSLRRDAYERLRAIQREMVEDRRQAQLEAAEARIAPIETSTSTIRIETRAQLAANEIDPERNPVIYEQFEGFMLDRVRAFRDVEGRDPGPRELHEIAEIGLAQVDTIIFDADSPEGERVEDVVMFQFGWTEYDHIPLAHRTQLEAALIKVASERLPPELANDPRFLIPSEAAVEEEFNRIAQQAAASGLTLDEMLNGGAVEGPAPPTVAPREMPLVDTEGREAILERIRLRLASSPLAGDESEVDRLFQDFVARARLEGRSLEEVVAEWEAAHQ